MRRLIARRSVTIAAFQVLDEPTMGHFDRCREEMALAATSLTVQTSDSRVLAPVLLERRMQRWFRRVGNATRCNGGAVCWTRPLDRHARQRHEGLQKSKTTRRCMSARFLLRLTGDCLDSVKARRRLVRSCSVGPRPASSAAA
jgi:hypothetical protein